MTLKEIAEGLGKVQSALEAHRDNFASELDDAGESATEEMEEQLSDLDDMVSHIDSAIDIAESILKKTPGQEAA